MYLYIFAMTAGDWSCDLIGTDKEAGKLSFNSDWLALIACHRCARKDMADAKANAADNHTLPNPSSNGSSTITAGSC